MRIRQLLSAFLLLASTLTADAAVRSVEAAREIAARHAERLGLGSVRPSLAADAATARAKSTATGSRGYYVFNNPEGHGFTIVSGDETMPEIAGYTTSGSFDASAMPDGLRWFLEAYEATVASGAYKAPGTRTAANAIAPMLTTTWNQEHPYNALCPTVYLERTATGCVATALAQIMRYHRYPKALPKDIDRYTTETYGVTAGGFKAGTEYDWDAMLDDYSGYYTSAQANAVATLMAHVGAAAGADYGPSTSAKTPAYVLADHFGYDPDLMICVQRGGFAIDRWTQLIAAELEAGRPVYYTGQSSDGGHAFVLDGMDADGLFHVNWGWGGYQDGYFDISSLSPEKGGAGSGSSSDGYVMDAEMIIGITPDNGAADEPLAVAPQLTVDAVGQVSITSGTRTDASGEFTLQMKAKLTNRSFRPFGGRAAVAVKNADGTFTPVSDIVDLSLDYLHYRTVAFNVSHSFPVGRTVLRLVEDNGGGWMPCCDSEATAQAFEATDTQLSKADLLRLSAELSVDGELKALQQGSLMVNITNQGDTEYMGTLYLYRSYDGEKPTGYYNSLSVSIPAGGSVSRTMAIKPDRPGDIRLWLDEPSIGTLAEASFTATAPDEPLFVLSSIETNATSDIERGRASIKGTLVEAPIVYADKARFTFGVTNVGATGSLTVTLKNCYDSRTHNVMIKYDTASGTLVGEKRETREIGFGETAYFTIDGITDDNGMAGCLLKPSVEMVLQAGDAPGVVLPAIGGSIPFSMNGQGAIVYVAGCLRDEARGVTFSMDGDDAATVERIDDMSGTKDLRTVDKPQGGNTREVPVRRIADGAVGDCSALTSLLLGDGLDALPRELAEPTPAFLETFNANAVVYSPKPHEGLHNYNAVVDGECQCLILSEYAGDFSPAMGFTARSAFFLTKDDEWTSGGRIVAVPFAFDTDGMECWLPAAGDEGKVDLVRVAAPQPDVAYLVTRADGTPSFEGVDVEIAAGGQQSASKDGKDYGFTYCYTNGSPLPDGCRLYRFDGTRFTAEAPAADRRFQGWLYGPADGPDVLEMGKRDETGIAPLQTDGESGMLVTSGRGFVAVKATKSVVCNIYTPAGTLVHSKAMKAGEQSTTILPAGIYIIAGAKYAVE